MAFNTVLYRGHFFRKINSCFLCSKVQSNLEYIETRTEDRKLNDEKEQEPTQEIAIGLKKHIREINEFLDENPKIIRYKHHLPSKLLYNRTYKNPEYLYLICPDIAEKIAEHVCKKLEGKSCTVAEANPGLGLITKCLLQKGILYVRLYELNTTFYEYLQELFKEQKAVNLAKRDFFGIYRYAYLDNADQGQRVENLLKGVAKKSWADDPVITVVGTVVKRLFLIQLVKSVILQKDIGTYGRVDLFLLTYDTLWKVFKATSNNSSRYLMASTVLLQIFFDVELIDKYPRKFFLPWQTTKNKKNSGSSDTDHVYFIRVTMKKDFPLHADHFVPFYCFMNTLYGRGNPAVIPTCEKWVPKCGQNLISPKLSHEDYFEDIDIFTKFKDLNPMQVISVFRELVAHPNYSTSPFLDMVEQEWIKSETIDTSLNDFQNQRVT